MRSCICDHLDTLNEPYPFWFTGLLPTGVSASGYIKVHQRMSGEWISAIELRAAAIVFGINIFVFSAHQKTPTWMPYRGERSDSSKIAIVNNQAHCLIVHNRNHFDPVFEV